MKRKVLFCVAWVIALAYVVTMSVLDVRRPV